MFLPCRTGEVAAQEDPALQVVVNELARMGTLTSANNEWIELFNNTPNAINLTGWTLTAADGTPTITLSGSIPAAGYFLLERTDDNIVPGVAADQIYTGALGNAGEILSLRDGTSALQDLVDAWYAGNNTTKETVQRVDPAQPGNLASNWRNGPNEGTPMNSGGSRSGSSALFALTAVAGCSDDHASSAEAATATLVERLRGNPRGLAVLLRGMPKGADLHSHLTGAAQTESLIDWGIASELCLDRTFTASSCGPGLVPMRNAESDPELYEQILGAWSMEGFVGPVLDRHAHFFATFPKFGAAAGTRAPDIFVEQKREAASERISYLEIMSSYGASQVNAIGTDYLPAGDIWSAAYLLERRQAMLADPRFSAALDLGQALVASAFAEADRQLGCGTPAAEAACAVELRVHVTGNRTNPRATVFAQFLYGFELAQRDDRVVAVNLVGKEEHPRSLTFYDDEMLAAGTLRELYASDDGLRPVRVSLHAGELIAAVLPNTRGGQRQLTFHIRRAVEVGQVDRIGHGVDLEHERVSADETPETLLTTMRERHILVEVNLTSNELLLGIEGRAHPLNTYLAHDVPVALSTDDEGVLRTDLTEQYVRAVAVQGLDYFALKRLARNALEYAFVPGSSLWRDPGSYHQLVSACAGQCPGADDPTPKCARYLLDNRRADLEWSLERDLLAFERSVVQ